MTSFVSSPFASDGIEISSNDLNILDVISVSIINQDEQILIYNWRFAWNGNENAPWNQLNPPLGQNCTALLDECVLNGQYRFVGTIDKGLGNKRVQIAYRRQGGPLKRASSVIQDMANSYNYIARGSLG